jgi:hypothetical protein
VSAPELLLAAWRNDARLFLHDVLAERDQPRPWQARVLDELTRPGIERACIVAPRGAGKSKLAAFLGLWRFVLNPDSTCVVLGPTERAVREGVLAELKTLWQRGRLPALFPEVELVADGLRAASPTWRCVGVSSDRPALVEGFHSERSASVILDEAKSVPDSFLDAIMPTLTGEDSRLLCVSSAGSPEGFLYRSTTSERHLWDYVQVLTVDDCPEVAETAERERARLGAEHVAYQQAWQSRFASVEEMGLFDAAVVERCFGIDPDVTWAEQLYGRGVPRWRSLGIDVGRNADRTVACTLAGRKVERFEVLPYSDEMLTASNLVGVVFKSRAQRVGVDCSGIGNAVAVRLSEHLTRLQWPGEVVAFVGGAKAQEPERYQNRKSEVALRLRTDLLDGAFGLGPRDDELLREMTAERLVQDARGRLRVEDPRRSPDRLDALLIARAAPEWTPSIVGYSPPGTY